MKTLVMKQSATHATKNTCVGIEGSYDGYLRSGSGMNGGLTGAGGRYV